MKKNTGISKFFSMAMCLIFLLFTVVVASAAEEQNERLLIKNGNDRAFSFTSDTILTMNKDASTPSYLKANNATRLDIGFGGKGGGNLECYSKSHQDRAGQFKFIFGGGSTDGAVIFTHYYNDGLDHWVDKMTLDYNGRLDMANGAYCDGYSWVNASSREYKENIEDLTSEDAMKALSELKPVSFTYKKDPGNQMVGFIAEDVPEIVATKDRKGTSSMDFVAVLTKVVQEQQISIDRLTDRIEELQNKVEKSAQ